jgi:hypothetical protein
VCAPTEDKSDDMKDRGQLFWKYSVHSINCLNPTQKFCSKISTQIRRKIIFKLTRANTSLKESSKDNGVNVENLSHQNSVMSKMFPHHKINKYIWTSPQAIKLITP